MYQAYLACRRTKRNRASALRFELNHEENLLQLLAELREQRYQPATSICFYTRKPKAREIFAADFRDRVVHHLVYGEIAPHWEKSFIHHSYACRNRKGIHAAAKALQRMLCRITANGRRRAYFHKIDIHNFFMTIDRRRLFDILARRCRDPQMLQLLRVIVFHDPTADYVLQDRDNLRDLLPRHKSLFYAAPFCGLAIGNLTSQFFANVYLDELDQFVKHVLRCRHYLRYVDDCILLAADAQQLQEWHAAIAVFLAERLALRLNERATRLGPVAGGIDFAGFIVSPGRRLVRRRVIGNLREKLRQVERQLVARLPTYTAYRFDEPTLNKCLAMLNSYLGHFQHAQTRGCVVRLWREFPFLRHYFKLTPRKVTLLTKPLRRMRRLQQQVRWLRWRFAGHLCLVAIGCYYEAFGADAQRLAALTGLRLHETWRGLRFGCGFHRKHRHGILARLKEQRVPLVLIHETGRELYGTKERMPYVMVEFPSNNLWPAPELKDARCGERTVPIRQR